MVQVRGSNSVRGTVIALHVKSPGIFSTCLQALWHRISSIESSGKEIVKTQNPKTHARATSEPLRGVILDEAFVAVRGKGWCRRVRRKRKELPEGMSGTDVCGEPSGRQVRYVLDTESLILCLASCARTRAHREGLWRVLTGRRSRAR